MSQKKLDHLDPMPFGKHKGTPMQDVPASYLHWLWTQNKGGHLTTPVLVYISENLATLKQEHTDGIWD